MAVLGADQGPQSAHKLMRENQTSTVLVLARNRTLRGIAREDEVARAVRAGSTSLPMIPAAEVGMVRQDDLLVDLFTIATRHSLLVVTDERDRVVGLIPRVTLLAALGNGGSDDRGSDPQPDEQLQTEGGA